MRVFALVLVLAGCSSPTVTIPSGPDEVAAPGCDGGKLYGDPPPPYSLTIDGQTFTVRNGQVWRPGENGTGQVFATLYDPKFASMFELDGCTILRRSDDGTVKVPVGKTFAAGFDAVADVQSLVNLDGGFTGFVLQSPAAQTVPEYVALRSCLLSRTCDFKDNRLDVIAEAAHEGGRGLRATCLGKVGQMVTAKASIETELVHFIRGDVLRLGAWFRAVEGVPYGLMDLESAILESAPGPRVLIEDGHLEVELKFGDKPRFKQSAPVPFPLGAWVRVEVEFTLQPDAAGRVRMWQDGVMVIDATGQTLPLPNTILNSLEVGITSNNLGRAVLDVDGLSVSAN